MINPNRKPIRRKKSYDLWANAMSRKWGISRDEFNAHPYDYAQYYEDNYDEAWEHINNKLAPYLHFPDRYKTSQHPTFSGESDYSGKFGIYNPSSIRGGSWAGDDGYVFSKDLINYKWPIDKTAEYVSQENVKLYTPYGRQILPKYSGGKDDDTYDDIWLNGNRYTYDQNALRYVNSDYLPVLFAQGGMLPEVTVAPSTRQRLDHPLLFNQLNVARMTPEQKLIYYKAKLGLGSDKLAEFMGELTPVGDATDVYRIGGDLSNGNLGAAAAGVGLFFLPNIIEKPLKRGFRAIKKILKKNPRIMKADLGNMSTDQLDAAYQNAAAQGDRETALRLLDEAYRRSGVPNTNITFDASGNPKVWYTGSEFGNHTIFDSHLFNATIGGESAADQIKGNFLTTDLPSATRYAGSDMGSAKEFTEPKTLLEKLAYIVGKYNPKRIHPTDRIPSDLLPEPSRLFTAKNTSPIYYLDETDRVVYPMYVNPGSKVYVVDFKNNPWSRSPIEFPNEFSVVKTTRDDINRTYKTNNTTFKTKDEALNYYYSLQDRFGKRYVENAERLRDKMFDFGDRTRSVEMFSSAPTYEKARLVERFVPNTSNGAVQTAAREGYTSVYMPNIIDSNVKAGMRGYPIDDFVTLNSEQMKLADITYDANGNLIPLKERFNWDNPDVRYSLIPAGFVAGIAAEDNKAKDLLRRDEQDLGEPRKYARGKDNDEPDFTTAPKDLHYDPVYQRLVGTNPTTGNLAGWEPYLGLLPEAVVTPSARWKLDNPIKWKDISSNLYVDTPKEMAVRNTTPTMEALNAITGGMLNRLSASQNLRLGYDLLTGNFADAGRGFVYGNNGVVSDSFAQLHPYWSMLINGAADVGAAGGFGSGRIPGVARNLTPLQLRNQLFVAKPPVGYDGVRRTLKRIAKGVLSGEKAEIDNPWWLNGEYAEGIKDKLSIYAYVPDWVGGAERTAYLKAFGDHAIKARADAWRMHNRIPQMFNTFVPNPRHPGSFTDPVGIKNLKYIPPMRGLQMIDFVNGVGGNIGVPKTKILGETGSIADGGLSKFGVTTTSDWFDLHPLSRSKDRLIPRLQDAWHKNIHMPVYRFADRLRGVSDRLRYDTKAFKHIVERDDPYGMDMFDPDMFPRTGAIRYIGDSIYNFEKWLKKVSSPPSFKFLKKLDDKLVNLEVGDITGGRPVLMLYDIPWTSKTTLVENPQGSLPKIEKRFMPGFLSDDILPGDVLDWEKRLD